MIMVVIGFMLIVFKDWGLGGSVVSVWLGIIGMIGDLMFFVGRIEVEKE